MRVSDGLGDAALWSRRATELISTSGIMPPIQVPSRSYKRMVYDVPDLLISIVRYGNMFA